MEKDFWSWHKQKSEIHTTKERPFFHEREIWFASVGTNVGFEQDGGRGFLRPVIILKKFNNEICWCVPMTKKEKKGRYYTPILLDGIHRTAILSQLRLIDVKRLSHKIGDVRKEEFALLKRKLTQLLV